MAQHQTIPKLLARRLLASGRSGPNRLEAPLGCHPIVGVSPAHGRKAEWGDADTFPEQLDANCRKPVGEVNLSTQDQHPPGSIWTHHCGVEHLAWRLAPPVEQAPRPARHSHLGDLSRYVKAGGHWRCAHWLHRAPIDEDGNLTVARLGSAHHGCSRLYADPLRIWICAVSDRIFRRELAPRCCRGRRAGLSANRTLPSRATVLQAGQGPGTTTTSRAE